MNEIRTSAGGRRHTRFGTPMAVNDPVEERQGGSRMSVRLVTDSQVMLDTRSASADRKARIENDNAPRREFRGIAPFGDGPVSGRTRDSRGRPRVAWDNHL